MASPETPSRTQSPRDRQRTQTRRALRDAALTLFATRGYDSTTTDDIADKAGVSTRTLFRYFPTKESVLFYGRRDWIQSVVEDYLNQPGSLNDLDALCAAFVSLAVRFSPIRRSLFLFEQALASSLTLRGREHDHRWEDIEKVAGALGTRRGLANPDEACALLATVVLMTHRRALDAWLAGPITADLCEIIGAEFQLLKMQFNAR